LAWDMGGAGVGVGMVAAAIAVVALTWLWAVLLHLVWRPYAVARAFERQGVRGPAYRFFVGNNKEVKTMLAATSGETLDVRCHDFVPRVMPYYRAWTSRYGRVFLSWSGPKPTLCVGDYDMARRVLSERSGLYVRPDPGPSIMSLLGMGLVFMEGDDWVRHRRVVHPAFSMDKLKAMTGVIAACATEVIGTWEDHAKAAKGKEVTVEVGQQFLELSADVISHTAFGSSYRQGKEVFLAQRELQFIAFASINNVRVPGSQYAPTKANVRRWQLERKVRGTLMAIIEERLAAAKESRGYGTDLLGLMLDANAAGASGRRIMSMDEIINECKMFFVAGHDTTSHLLTWAMFLLGTHPEWQQKLRQEVLQECGGAEAPILGEALNKLKLVSSQIVVNKPVLVERRQ
jgi:cytochrome P450 family 709